MHRPEMWGRVLFTRRPTSEPVAVTPLPGRDARALALDFYYAQLDFFRAHRRWASTFTELNWTAPTETASPVFTSSADGYEFSAPFTEGTRRRAWTIRQDRRLTLN